VAASVLIYEPPVFLPDMIMTQKLFLDETCL